MSFILSKSIIQLKQTKQSPMKQLFLLLLSFSFLQVSAQYNRAFLGIRDTDMNKQKADLLGLPNAFGSYIKYVYEGTAAADAGLEPFDYITAIDDDRMAFHSNLADLLARHKPGDQVILHIVRRGKNIKLNAILGNSSDSCDKHIGGTAFLGIREHDNSRDYKMGVTIETVRNSSAIDLGLDDGDIIMAINGYPMVDWSDITTVLNNMDAGDPIKIDYTRNNQPNRARGTIGGEGNDDNHYSRRGFLGVYTSDMSMKKAELLGFDHHYGSYIKSIIPNTAAERAGLEPLDYIVAINDYQLNRDRSLTGTLNKFSKGDKITIHYIRNGQANRAQAILGEPTDNQTCSPCSDEPFFGVSQRDDNNGSRRGVKVNIVSNSAASRAGLHSKDIIIQFDNKPLIDWSDLSAAINGTDPGEKIKVVYIRDGDESSTEVIIGSECDQNKTKQGDSYSYSYHYDDDGNNDNNYDNNDSAPAVDMNRIKVDVQDLNDTDSGIMRNQGITPINNLSVENISLFPNPSKGMFRLEFELPNSGDTSIKVFNSSGRIIYSFDLGEYSGLFSDEVDISQNGPGAYYLNVTQGNASVTKKIMLQY